MFTGISGDFAEFSEHEASARTARDTRDTRDSVRAMIQNMSREIMFDGLQSPDCLYLLTVSQMMARKINLKLFSKRSNIVITQSPDRENSIR